MKNFFKLSIFVINFSLIINVSEKIQAQNHQDQKINQCYISSLFDMPMEFYNQIQERLDMEVNPLRYTNENKNLAAKRLLGYEVGIGMLFREVVE